MRTPILAFDTISEAALVGSCARPDLDGYGSALFEGDQPGMDRRRADGGIIRVEIGAPQASGRVPVRRADKGEPLAVPSPKGIRLRSIARPSGFCSRDGRLWGRLWLGLRLWLRLWLRNGLGGRERGCAGQGSRTVLSVISEPPAGHILVPAPHLEHIHSALLGPIGRRIRVLDGDGPAAHPGGPPAVAVALFHDLINPFTLGGEG